MTQAQTKKKTLHHDGGIDAYRTKSLIHGAILWPRILFGMSLRRSGSQRRLDGPEKRLQDGHPPATIVPTISLGTLVRLIHSPFCC